MPGTYEPIATTTLGTAASNITFSSIPSTYTDLRLVFVGYAGSGSFANFRITFNSDNGGNYSRTTLGGNGGSPSSFSNTNQTYIDLGIANLSISQPSMHIMDLFSYAGSTNKTILLNNGMEFNGGSYAGAVELLVGLWRSTSAINTIRIATSSNTYIAGTTATLYGIKNA
jgi:hypothetical protein